MAIYIEVGLVADFDPYPDDKEREVYQLSEEEVESMEIVFQMPAEDDEAGNIDSLAELWTYNLWNNRADGINIQVTLTPHDGVEGKRYTLAPQALLANRGVEEILRAVPDSNISVASRKEKHPCCHKCSRQEK